MPLIDYPSVVTKPWSVDDFYNLTEEEQRQRIKQDRKVGLRAPKKDGFLTETGEGFLDSALRIGEGLGASLSEAGITDAVDKYFADVRARHRDWEPYEGYKAASWDPISWGRTIGNAAGTTGASLLTGGVTTLATGNPSLGMAVGTAAMFSHMWGNKVREYREAMPDMDDGTVKMIAAFEALGESLIENYGPMDVGRDVYSALAKRATKEAIEETAKRATKEAIKETTKRFGSKAVVNFLKKMGTSALEEGSEEIAQTYWDVLSRAMAGDKNLPWPSWEQVKEEFMGGAIGGVGLGAGWAAFEPAVNRWNTTPDGMPKNKTPNGMNRVETPEQEKERLSREAIYMMPGVPTMLTGDFIYFLAKKLGVNIHQATDEEVAAQRRNAAAQKGVSVEEMEGIEIPGWREKGSDDIYLNPQSGQSMSRAFGHEVKHWLDEKYPELAKKFDKLAESLMNDRGRQALKEAEELWGKAGDAKGEFFCDVCGQLAENPDMLRNFCMKLEAKEQGLGVKFAEAIKDFVQMVLDLLQGKAEYQEQFDHFKQLEEQYGQVLADVSELNHYGRDEQTGAPRSFDAGPVNVSEVKTDPAFFQHRKGADTKTGVVPGHKITGKFSPTTGGNFIFWEDKNGQKWLVNGHHRWQMVQEQNVPKVNGIVLRESEGVTKQQAREEGVKVNLREGTATVEDAAEYFRNNKMTQEEAQADSLLKEQDTNKNTSRGYWIGTYAGDNLYANFKDGSLGAGKAAAIAEVAQGNLALEDAGLKMAKTTPPAQLRSALQLLKQSLERQGDKTGGGEQMLFDGLFDDSAIKLAEQQSKIAGQHIGSLRSKVAIAKKAVELGKDKANIQQLRKELGVQVKDINDVKRKLAAWEKELNEWEHYETNSNLIDQINQELNEGKSQPEAKPQPRPEPKTEAKPEPKEEEKPKPEQKAEPKAEEKPKEEPKLVEEKVEEKPSTISETEQQEVATPQPQETATQGKETTSATAGEAVTTDRIMPVLLSPGSKVQLVATNADGEGITVRKTRPKLVTFFIPQKLLRKKNSPFGVVMEHENLLGRRESLVNGRDRFSRFLVTPEDEAALRRALEVIEKNYGLSLDSRMDAKAYTEVQQALPVEDKSAERIDKKEEPINKIEDFGEKIGGARKDLATKKTDLDNDKEKTKNTNKKDGPKWRDWYLVAQNKVGKWMIMEKPRKGGMVRLINFTAFDTEEKALSALPAMYIADKYSFYQTSGGMYAIYRRQRSSRTSVPVRGGFVTKEDAQKWALQHVDELETLRAGFGEKDLALKVDYQRTGERRLDHNATSQDFSEAFGFRGVEFGNWENQQERQQLMNDAYEALHDLAELLNIPPKAISLNGQLGLAFGSRGRGGDARAHYEPDYVVINLTKPHGAGSLAHEWFHALDNYFGKQARLISQPSNAFLSDSSGNKFNQTGMRQELLDKFNAVKQAIEEINRPLTEEELKLRKRGIEKLYQRLQDEFKELRKRLADPPENKYRKKQIPSATEIQLKEFDELAAKILSDNETVTSENWDWETQSYINEDYQKLGELYKNIVGRKGFTADGKGPLTYLTRVSKNITTRRLELTKDNHFPTAFYNGAKELDRRRSENYWSKPLELFARAFSSYIEDKLEESGRKSEFLSYGSNNDLYNTWKIDAADRVQPFPEGEERKKINQAFQAFFNELKHETTPEGNERLYSFVRKQETPDALREQEMPNPASDNPGEIQFSFRQKEPPKHTLKGYKLMRIDEDGNLYALFIDRANQMQLGQWYDADSPNIDDLKKLSDGVYVVDREGNATPFTRANMPSVKEVDEATANGQRFMKIGRYADGSQRIENIGVNGSGTVATFAYRPGWHATNAPSAPHIGGGQRRANEVWVEIEYAADNDFRSEAASKASLMKNGKPNPKEAQLDHIPEDGYYYYRTNSNADEKQDWILTGSIKPVRILSDAEVERLNRDGGFRPDAHRKAPRIDENKKAPEEQQELAASFSHSTRKPGSSSVGKTPRTAVLSSFDALLNINDLNENTRNVVSFLRDLVNSFENNIPIPGQKRPLTVKNFISSLNDAGFSHNHPGDTSVYQTFDDITIRISDHQADAKNFSQDNTQDNLSIVLEKPRTAKDFRADDKVAAVEALYLRKHLEQHPELLPEILKDIATAAAKGKYYASAPAFDYHFSGTPEQIAMARLNLAIDALTNRELAKNLDRIYLRAVKYGDMKTAAAMVRAREEAMGYSNDESWKMDHRAPNSKDDVSLIDLKASGLVPADYWDHQEWYTSSPEEGESFRIIKAALELAERRKAEGNERPVGIRVYRAVDKTKNRLEGGLRNGDWVTPSRAYAENEGLDNPNGHRIISQYCLLRNLYWDGNSIAELGYDDGNDYSYKDTANNRKLRDVVTYDDEGNVIPLSKRFNKHEYDTRFSFVRKQQNTSDNKNGSSYDWYERTRRQINPIIEEGQYKEEYQEGLDADTYERKSNATLRRQARDAIVRLGGINAALEAFLKGKRHIVTDVEQMMARVLVNTSEYQELSKEQREAFNRLYRRAGTEAGRTLAARRLGNADLRDINNLREFVNEFATDMQIEHPDENARQKIKESTGIDIDNLPEYLTQDHAELDKFLRTMSSQFAETKDKIYEYWVNAILSGLTTHTANTLGNAGNMLYELGPKRLAEAFVNLVVKNPQGATFGELKRMWSAFNYKQAWNSAKPLLIYDMLDTEGKFDMEHGTKAAIGGKLGRVIRTPGRFLRFADQFVKCLIRPMEATAMAYREAKAQKLGEAETKEYIQKQLEDENSHANEWGRHRALELTFNEDPGALANAVIRLRNSNKFVAYLLPFIRTPANLLRQGIRKGPVGAFNLAWETIQLVQGQRKADNEYIAHWAEQLAFWGGMMMLIAGHGDDDEPWITGNDEAFGAEGQFKRQHLPPMSIRIGNKWYSYRRIEPLATGLAAFADGYNAYAKADNGQKMTSALKMMMKGTAKIITDKSYLQSFEEVYRLFNDPEKELKDTGTNFLASWSPNVYRQTVNAFHDYTPNYKAGSDNWILNAFQQTISRAGFYKQVPKIDYFGRPVPKDLPDNETGPGSIAYRLGVPIARRKATIDDPVEQLIWNYNKTAETPYWPSLPSPYFQVNGKKYEVANYDAYAIRAGQLAHKAMLQAVKQRRLNVSNPTQRDIDLLRKVFTAARKQAKLEAMQHKQVIRR